MEHQTLIKILSEKIVDSIVPITHYGKKKKEEFSLYTRKDKKELIKQLEALYNILENTNEKDLEELRSILKNINNIELILSKLREENLEIYEIFEIKKFIYFYNKLRNTKIDLLKPAIDLKNLFLLLNPEGKNNYTFYVYDKYSENLANLRKEEKYLVNKIKKEENTIRYKIKEEYNIQIISKEFVVPKTKKNIIEKLIDSNLVIITRETFSNLYFDIRKNDYLQKSYEKKQLIKNKIQEEEKKVLSQVSGKLRESLPIIIEATKEIGNIDFMLAKVFFTKTFDYCIPEISDNVFEFTELVFLPLSTNPIYTPVSAKMPKGLTILVGTNMGGKTTLLKTIGLTEFMLKYGLLIPAKSIKMPLLDDIFFVNEDIESDSLSSFAINVERLVKGLKKESNTLLLIDEFAKGTNPIEGNALAKAVAEWIFENRKNNFTIFATHFNGPVNKKYHLLKVGRIKNSFRSIEDAIDHSVKEYKGNFPMEALKISEFIGLNKKIIKNAKECIKNDSN